MLMAMVYFVRQAELGMIVLGKRLAPLFLLFLVGCAGTAPGPQTVIKPTVVRDGDWYSEEGINAFARQDYEQAIALWREAVQLLPRQAALYNFIGLAHYRRGEDGTAALAFEAAVQLDPGFAEAFNNLGYVLFRQRQYQRAMEVFQRALAIDPNHLEARENFKLALAASSGVLDGWAYTLTEEAGHTDDLDQKIALYRRALAVDSTYARTHNNLGVALYYHGEFSEAIAEFQIAVRLDPSLAEGHNNLGYLYIDLAKYPEAIQKCKEALEIDPGYIDAYNNLGQALAKSGDLDGAVATWESILILEPANRVALYQLKKHRNP